MIEAIVKSLDPIFNGMDWVYRYGGLAETWGRDASGPNDTTFQETFPVVSGSDPGCDDECLTWLSPDAGKRNVLFWTLLTDALLAPVPANYSRAKKPIQYTQTARLNVWLNFQDCQTCDPTSFLAYVQYLHSQLDGRVFSLTSPLSLKGTMRVTGAPSRDYKDMWGAWTFGSDQKLFVHPFDFFGLDITFTWIQNQSCPVIPTC